jgi:hypothetical protein
MIAIKNKGRLAMKDEVAARESARTSDACHVQDRFYFAVWVKMRSAYFSNLLHLSWVMNKTHDFLNFDVKICTLCDNPDGGSLPLCSQEVAL